MLDIDQRINFDKYIKHLNKNFFEFNNHTLLKSHICMSDPVFAKKNSKTDLNLLRKGSSQLFFKDSFFSIFTHIY